MLKKQQLIFILVFVVAVQVLSAQNSGYKVIVNKDNPVTSLTSKQISNYFLKKVTVWEDGEKVKPVDLSMDSAIRSTFTEKIHGRKVMAVKAFWQKKIFTGQGVPPIEKKTDVEVVRYVRANPWAIGYVSAGAEVAGVKVIK